MKVHDNTRKFNILLNVPQFSAVTLKPSGIRGCGATQAFLTGKGIGDYAYSRIDFFPSFILVPSVLAHIP